MRSRARSPWPARSSNGWDNLGLIDDAPEVEQLARSVDDSGGVVFVPAFSGLFAPYWRDDARGVIVGLTRFANKGHIAGQHSRRPPTKPATSSRPCSPTPGWHSSASCESTAG